MKDATKILKRYEGNPVISIDENPGYSQMFNPAPVKFGDETIILLSVMEYQRKPGQGHGGATGRTRLARSKDGIHFTIEDKDFISVSKYKDAGLPDADKFCHLIDNRVSKIDDTYYILTPTMVALHPGPSVMLGKTTDFKNYEPIGTIGLPVSRGSALFPEKINGKYYKLDRPGGGSYRGDIWISESEDMIHWGKYQPLIAPGWSYWNETKIGPTAPIKTKKGWLDIIHGVTVTAGGKYYYMGAILLDLEEPWKVIGKTSSYLMRPETEYERHGNCDNCIFVCGAIADEEKDEIKIYYGACDEAIGLATGRISEIVDACIEEI